MARQDALQGSLPLLVLKLLARRGALHGYGLATQIELMSDETLRVEEGSLYPALHRLEEAGWIKARWTTTETGRRARVYASTETHHVVGRALGVLGMGRANLRSIPVDGDGRIDLDLPWERTDQAELLADAAGLPPTEPVAPAGG